jgi:hypothetical protein
MYMGYFFDKLDRSDFAFKDTPINGVELKAKAEG